MRTDSNTPIRSPETIDKLGDPEIIRKGQLRQARKRNVTEVPDLSRLKDSDSFAIKFDNIKDRVISILQFDKFARRNDLWLLLLYYHKMGYLKLQIEVSQFNKINMPESISRARRSIFQEIREGKHPKLNYLLEDTKTLEIRKQQELNYEEYFSKEKVAQNQDYMTK